MAGYFGTVYRKLTILEYNISIYLTDSDYLGTMCHLFLINIVMKII